MFVVPEGWLAFTMKVAVSLVIPKCSASAFSLVGRAWDAVVPLLLLVVPVCSELLFRELSLLRSRQLLASKHDVIVTFMQPGMECRDELYFHRSGMIKQLCLPTESTQEE